jgi:hypothetical protein
VAGDGVDPSAGGGIVAGAAESDVGSGEPIAFSALSSSLSLRSRSRSVLVTACSSIAPKRIGRHAGTAAGEGPLQPAETEVPPRTSTAIEAASVGVRPTRTPLASSASALAAAVPEEPETIAPAWPICLPAGAVKPAM